MEMIVSPGGKKGNEKQQPEWKRGNAVRCRQSKTSHRRKRHCPGTNGGIGWKTLRSIGCWTNGAWAEVEGGSGRTKLGNKKVEKKSRKRKLRSGCGRVGTLRGVGLMSRAKNSVSRKPVLCGRCGWGTWTIGATTREVSIGLKMIRWEFAVPPKIEGLCAQALVASKKITSSPHSKVRIVFRLSPDGPKKCRGEG